MQLQHWNTRILDHLLKLKMMLNTTVALSMEVVALVVKTMFFNQ